MSPAARRRRFCLILFLLLAALLALVKPNPNGDVLEYSLTTIAFASHGTPDIRLDDIARGKELLPHLAVPYGFLEKDMREHAPKVYPAFIRGQDGKVYPLHFWGYMALAAAPFKLFDKAGVSPFKGFQVINLAAVFLLGLSLFRLFQSELKALAVVGLFMLCGGTLYASWTSPECLGAACLLAGLILYCSGAPLRGALLAGLAAQQNPTMLAFFGFAPLILVCLQGQLTRRHLAALGAGAALGALPFAFNLWQFGSINIIARQFSDASLIGPTRLASFFFDLNQGMLIAIPGVLLALAMWGWQTRRDGVLLALCTAMVLTMVLPALAILNWNSSAAGVMRYAFWAAMPLLFVLVWRLHRAARWPLALLPLVLLQGACMVSAASYSYVEFSPAARFVLRHWPQLYHPEPEIFVERSGNHDNYYWPHEVYVFSAEGKPVITLYNTAHPGIEQRLCGDAGKLAASNATRDSYRGWRYIHGPVQCGGADVSSGPATFTLAQFKTGQPVRLESGWSRFEDGQGEWAGAWSLGARSRILVTLAAGSTPSSLTLLGLYFNDNARTRVTVNGADLGWHRLSTPNAIALPTGALANTLDIVLEHEKPQSPGPADTRQLALFLREVTLK